MTSKYFIMLHLVNSNWLIDDIDACNQIDIITSNSSQYQQAKSFWNIRLKPVEPYGFVYPQSTNDVSAAVKCAKQREIPIAIRGGGHSYEGYSQGGSNGYLVIDLEKLNDIKIDPLTQISEIGGGSRLGHIYGTLWSSGNFSIPSGTCATVGIGGHATGGGFGRYSRTYGMVTDNIKEMEVVTANGDIIKCNQNENQDLFWALRGSGTGSYGVVTKFHIKVFHVKDTILNFAIQIPVTVDTFPDIFSQIQGWISKGISKNIGITLGLDGKYIGMSGVIFGDSVEQQEELAREMIKALPINQKTYPFTRMPFINTVINYSGSPGYSNVNELTKAQEWTQKKYFKARGGYIYKPLPKQFLKTYIQNLKKWPEGIFTLLDVQGGALDLPELLKETSVAHRNTLFDVQMMCNAKTKEQGDDIVGFLDEAYTLLTPYFNGTYINYMDVKVINWPKSYYGNNLNKLSRIKQKWDPNNRFNNPRSVPLP